MTLTLDNAVGALAFLILGVIEVALARRFLYPPLRRRHERAKLTQTQGIDPGRIMLLVWFQSLVILPVAGFLLGHRLRAMMG
jgi:branched-subunit amino acid ABC-type transport system permease component